MISISLVIWPEPVVVNTLLLHVLHGSVCLNVCLTATQYHFQQLSLTLRAPKP